jgi:hypothetical protein
MKQLTLATVGFERYAASQSSTIMGLCRNVVKPSRTFEEK